MRGPGRPSGDGSQVERVLRLARDLSAPWTVDDLALRHGVTSRTIRRDLVVIRRALGLSRVCGPDGVAFVLAEHDPARRTSTDTGH